MALLTRKILLIVAAITLAAPGKASAAIWSFQSLGDLSGGPFQSAAYDVSDDGSAAVGSGWTSNNTAMRWSASTEMTAQDFSGKYSHSSAISADGSIAVGWVWDQATARVEAYLWSEATGAVPLGDLATGTFESYANDVSADGSVVVGLGHTDLGYQASRWTAGTGQVALGDLAGGIFHSSAFGVSRDGSVIVGAGNSAAGEEAFRWTQATGMVGLGDLAGGTFGSHAEDVLANGDVVIGRGHSSSGQEAFRWTQTSGMVGLGDLAGGAFESAAWGGSADGSLIVGTGNTALGLEAFIWDDDGGMRNLEEVLAEHGTTLTGWQLTHALAMSADGKTIVGAGYNPDGNLEAWIIQEGAEVPEPSTIIVWSVIIGLSVAGRLSFGKCAASSAS